MVAHHHINTTTWRGLAFTLLWLLASHISKGQKEYQHSPRTGYLSVNGSQLYYETIGHGPALLLLHAGMMNSRMWQHQQHHFARDRFVIVCDLRGYGKTVDSTASYAMCDGIKALLDTLRITKADVVGASIGSIVATELALHYPSYIRKLVLVSPGLKGFQQNLPADSLLQKNGRLMQEAYLVQKDTVRTAEYFIRSWFDGPHRKPGKVNPAERQKALSMAIDKARRGFAYGPVFDSLPVLPRLQGLHKPLLVIIGQYDHTIIKAIGDTLRATVPHCQLKQLPKTAHLGNMERPRAFNAMLRRFLQ